MGKRALPGAALQAALEERGCALGAAEARRVAESLIDLIASGLIVADTSAETPPSCNTGESLYIEGGDRA